MKLTREWAVEDLATMEERKRRYRDRYGRPLLDSHEMFRIRANYSELRQIYRENAAMYKAVMEARRRF